MLTSKEAEREYGLTRIDLEVLPYQLSNCGRNDDILTDSAKDMKKQIRHYSETHLIELREELY